MSFTPTSPITGAAISGLTSPTYTIVADTPPSAVSKQYAVSGLGGTQTGVTAHSLSSPFTQTMFRPSSFKVLGQPNPSGVIRSFPNNTFTVLTRKGVSVLASQPIQTMLIKTDLRIPSGADTYDLVNIKAAISAHIGLLWQIAQGLTDTVTTGTM
ncbi:TPA_asm: coat protein [ssRNA phage SRR7976357_1]|uniref:Coat protein n=1 Tax=ssRNA phage SRR7976357_1 TaxID=2786738 RepID=A0A8S5L0T2_9VIRU|nr:coat protein [ssRNA phage SRR7976357_1]DAD51241.1 TPA_asm: coat protein [ssRNA phage SRR7976357_1]